METVPQIKQLDVFNQMTFYSFLWSGQCILKASNLNLVLSEKMPIEYPTRHSLIGLFHHKCMEIASSAPDELEFDARIEGEISQLQTVTDKLPFLKSLGSVSGWKEINNSANQAYKLFKFHQKNSSNTIPQAEKSLTCKNSFFNGRPDFFLIKDKRAFLKEYKSGEIRGENGEISKEYEKQLLFYSMLLIDNFDIDKVDCSLESARGEHHTLDIQKQDIELFRKQAIEQVAEINKAITQSKNLASIVSPSKEHCSSCGRRLLCTAFVSQQEQIIGVDSDTYVFTGSLTEISNSSPTVTVKIQNNAQTRSIVVPSEAASELEIHKTYTFFDLGFQNGSFRWAPRSRIFKNG